MLAEMESVRRGMRAAADAARAEFAKARKQVQSEMKRARAKGTAERDRPGAGFWWDFVRARPRRRPPHNPRNDGGEPAPVKPRPKPVPMQGGAEAPVE